MNFYEVINNFLFIIIIVLSYVIVFIAICSVNKNMELEYKIKITNTQIALQKQNYLALNKSIENYNAFKHDVRHHILAIKAMVDSKNYIAASEYMNKFTNNQISQNIGVLCRNFTVDSILKYYMSTAVNNNIEFNVNLNIPEAMEIDNLDMSIVIGNCVENALEACNNIVGENRKYIYMEAKIKGLQLIIFIKNSFNGKVIKEGNSIKTSKNGENHGIGLENVKKIAEKYFGHFEVKYNDEEFEVHIIMNFTST
jgi:sensor histidine kinase regulating citrate/malate metabolism